MKHHKTHFKTSKAELLFVVLPDTSKDIVVDMGYIIFDALAGKRKWLKFEGISGLPGLDYYDYHRGGIKLPQGNWQLIGKLSTITDKVAKGLVDMVNDYFTMNHPPMYRDYITYEIGDDITYYKTAIESLTSIATHLGMELTDNIYLLNKI